ncbi:MAG: Hpt domain-containing protein [Myxococcota bacterium]
MNDPLAELARAFVPRARERAAVLRELLEAAQEPEGIERARREAHNLAGTAGSYGLAAFGAAVKRIESALRDAEAAQRLEVPVQEALIASLDAARERL